MLLKLRLDTETSDHLCALALRELRTVDAEAIVLLRTGLGLPVPLLPVSAERDRMGREVVGV